MRIPTLLAVLGLFCSLFAQDTWVKTCPVFVDDLEYVEDVLACPDGGYAFQVNYCPGIEFEGPATFCETVKLDSQGNYQWCRGDQTVPWEYIAAGLVNTSDNGIISATFNLQFDPAIHNYLIKRDSLGNHPQEVQMEDFEIASMKNTQDGNIILAGRNVVNDQSALRLINEELETLWTKTISLGENSTSWFSSVCRTSDGGYLAAGTICWPDSVHPEFFIVRTNQDGDTLWTRSQPYDNCRDVCEASDGSIYVTGRTGYPQNNAVLLKYQPDGDLIYTRFFPLTTGENYEHFAVSVLENPGSHEIILSRRPYLLACNPVNGDSLWQSPAIQGIGNGDENFVYAAGGYFIAGVAGYAQVVVTKTDQHGFWVSNEDHTEPVLIQPTIRNYPNPFHQETTIAYGLAEKGEVHIEIYNLKGQRIRVFRSQSLEKGEHVEKWDGRNEGGQLVGSGVYLATCFQHGKTISSAKMVIIH